MKKITTFMLFTIMMHSHTPELYAWANRETHPAQTDKATIISKLDLFIKNNLGFVQGLNSELELQYNSFDNFEKRMKAAKQDPSRKRNIIEWIKAGSIIEDETKYDLRFNNHFHDPTRNAGLDNTESDYWMSKRFKGISALSWAIDGPTTINLYSWAWARYHYYGALTLPMEDWREDELAKTFLALGHVVHMIEDMGVPAHVRNDSLNAHVRSILFDTGEALEVWTEKKIKNNKGNSLWSGTSPVVFNKIADYFDTGSRYGEDAEDYYGSSLPIAWGLSETTNYQFLSLSTIFRPNDGSKYYFPHPAAERMGNDIVEESEWVSGTYKIYFNGDNYGVPHMARKSYTYYKSSHSGYSGQFETDNTNTTDDEQVIQDYANITIPRTINYTSGLINYFLRGKLDVILKWTENPNEAEITITNKSMNSTVEQALKGGDFELFAYYENGDLVPISFDSLNWSNGVLPYGDYITGTFTVPAPGASPVEYYRVVYKGQIVPNDNTSHEDPDDMEAIACGKTSVKLVLYYMNCSPDYKSYPSHYDADLAALQAYCQSQEQLGQDVRVGLFYVPRQWFEEEGQCPRCCTDTIGNVLPNGYSFPEQFYYEMLTAPPTTRAELVAHKDTLLSDQGPPVKPEYLIIVHNDGNYMFYSQEGWDLWYANPLKTVEDWVRPGEDGGPYGVLYSAIDDYVTNWDLISFQLDVILREGSWRWLNVTKNIMIAVDEAIAE